MAVRNLYTMMSLQAAGADPVTMRNTAVTNVRRPVTSAEQSNGRPFFDESTIVEVFENGQVSVQLGDRQVVANPVSDYPFRAGMNAWISSSQDGRILVHGPIL